MLGDPRLFVLEIFALKKPELTACLSGLYMIALLRSTVASTQDERFTVVHIPDSHEPEIVARFTARVPPAPCACMLADGPTILLPKDGGGALAWSLNGSQWTVTEVLDGTHGTWGEGFTPLLANWSPGGLEVTIAHHQPGRWGVYRISGKSSAVTTMDAGAARPNERLPVSIAARATCGDSLTPPCGFSRCSYFHHVGDCHSVCLLLHRRLFSQPSPYRQG
jgi:hypothetical protein